MKTLPQKQADILKAREHYAMRALRRPKQRFLCVESSDPKWVKLD